jgi:hypothetical protein
LAVLAMVLLSVGSAQAQAEPVEQTPNPLEADFKGTVGLGLVGAELGFVIPALAGAEGVWPYIVFPVVGAGAGAVSGYFLLEKGDGHPELAVASLMVGMALFIPAMVFTIAETSYDPESDAANGSPALARNGKRLHAARRYAEAGPGMVRYAADGSLLLAPPAVTAGHSDSPREALRTGAPLSNELRLSLLSGRF